MKEWNYTFDPVSKTEWLRQVEQDLKGKSLSSLQSEWWPGEELFPVHLIEDRPSQNVSLPERFFLQPPLLMEWIDTSQSDGIEVHSKIIRALQYGSQTVVLNVSDNKNVDFDLWLKGVFTDMVGIEINLHADHNFNATFLSTILPPGTVLRLNRGSESSSDFLKSAIELQDVGNTKSFHFVYFIEPRGNWTRNVADIFKKINSDLEHWVAKNGSAVDFFQQCILMIEPDNIYLKQIIQTRVLQLLWIHFLTTHQTKSAGVNSIVECHIRSNEPIDPDQYLIRAAASALGASMTGVKSVCIQHLINETIPSYYQRVNRNIHHLLSLESGVYRGVDPVAGSYTIDYYTHKWTHDILEQLQ